MRVFRSAVTALTVTLLAAVSARWPRRSRRRASPGRPRRPVWVLGAVAMAGVLLMFGSPVASAGGTPPPVSIARWQQTMKRLAVPGRGCFTASYPAVAWRSTRCTAAPHHPYPPSHGKRPPQVVGNGVDYSAEVSGGNLTSVTGSFDSITAGATETGQQNGMGGQVANTFSLQLNAKPFASPACAGSGTPATCQGWQQFIYSTTSNTVFMQYWLLNYNAACPAGWNTYMIGTSTFCYKNSAATALTGGALTAPNLPTANLTGNAAGGGNDSVVLTTGTGNATAVGADNVLTLAAAWTGVEWGVFGDCCGTSANFSAGTTLVVRTTTHNGTTTAPACVFEGFTGETNNLNLAATPALVSAPSPALVSNQTSAVGTPSCATAKGDGDTHLDTFSKLLYDFQASGDFQSVATSSGFIVQNRQVSGAPSWPSAAVNQAVAARIGSNNVAVCTAPTRLEVNGQTVALGNGGTINLAGGGSVALNGTTYLIQDTSGDSVTAAVNSNGSVNWINAGVGLGRWPQPVEGLLASAANNPDAIAASNGTVLNAPFDFNTLYSTYGNGWRVSGLPDMLTACSGPPPATVPWDVFYANQLPSQIASQARQICTAAGVQIPALLNACMIDEAVEGQTAPGVYQSLPAGLFSGQVTACGSGTETQPTLSDISGTGDAATQYLMHAFANAYDGTQSPKAYSWDAVNPVDCYGGDTIITKSSSPTDQTCAITRPDGSAAGIKALASSVIDGGQPCLDYARSSRGTQTGDPAGLLWVAYAKDAVSWTTPSGGTAKPASLTQSQLQGIYTCTITNWSQVGGGNGTIVPVLPQVNSGTRAFFLAAIGVTFPGSCVVNGSISIPGDPNSPVQIDDNTGVSMRDSGGNYITGNQYVFTSQPNAIFPYSVADWIAQQPAPAGGGHATDSYAPGALGQPAQINGVTPVLTHPGPPVTIDTINPSFPSSFFRIVWNVVRNAGTKTAPVIPAYLVPVFGPTSKSPHGLCTDTADIRSYGFLAIGAACGAAFETS